MFFIPFPTTFSRARTFLGSFVSMFLLVLTSSAQPAFFEPMHGFYKARGTKVAATWSLDRTELPADGALTATLTIRGAANPHEIVRPDLAKVRDDDGRHPFAERFQIEDVPGKPEAKEAAFAYRLRPRSSEVTRLPTLEYWYDTGVKVGNPFKKTTAKGFDIVVTRVAKAAPPAVPLLEPDRLFEVTTGAGVLQHEPFAAGLGSWLVIFVLGLLAAIGWYAAWRQVYPDGARLARIRRSRAVRRATDAIRRAGRSADPVGAIATAVLGYLRSRFALAPGNETPIEVGEGLSSAGLPVADADAAVAFLRRCDEARFAPNGVNPLSLASDAETLLARLEAAE